MSSSVRDAPDSRHNTVLFLTLIFIAGALAGPVSSLLPVFVDAVLHHPPSYTAGLRSLQLAMTGLFALVGGALADRLGQKRALVLSFGGIAVSSLIFTLSDNVALVLVIAGLGVTSSLQTVSGQSYVLAAARRNTLGGLTAVYYLGNTLGGALGNAVAGPSAERFGFGAVGLAGFVLSLVLVASALKWLPVVRADTVEVAPRLATLIADYVRLARRPRIAAVGTLRFLLTALYGMVSLVVPLLVYRQSGSVATAGLYATTSLLVATVTQLLIGRLVDRFGPIEPTKALTLVILGATAYAALAPETTGSIFSAGVALTAALWGVSTTMTSLVREAGESSEHGRTLGLVHLLWSGGMLVGTFGGGWLVGLSPVLPFAAFGLLNLPSVLIAFSLGRGTFMDAPGEVHAESGIGVANAPATSCVDDVCD